MVLYFDKKTIRQSEIIRRTFFIFPGQALEALSAVGFPTMNKIYSYHNSQIFILHSTK
jgi:hypothetical protein